MSNKKNIFLNLILIFFFIGLGYFVLKSETKNDYSYFESPNAAAPKAELKKEKPKKK